MRKHCLFTAVLLSALVLASIGGTSAPVAANNGVKVQLAMILDGSDSISGLNWNIMKNGLADAVEDPDCVPQDGSVELTVIQFGGASYLTVPPGAVLEVAPVVITSGNAATVAGNIRAISQMKGFTPIACATLLAADTLAGSTNFNPGVKQALNLVTDGAPNVCCAGPGYTGTWCDYGPGEGSAEAARDYAISLLGMDTDPQDEFDAEFIGTKDGESEWLRTEIVWPEQADGNGYYAPPFDKGPGWVRVVANATEFAATICEKFEVIIERGMITAHKFNDLNGDGDQDTGEPNLSGWTMTLYEGAGCTGDPLESTDTDINGNVTFSDRLPGDYSVAETLKDGWTNTTDICQNVALSAGGSETLEFGNRGALSISGVKFNDLNGNGVNDTEPGLGDWTINLTGQMTKSTTTASDGSYSFTSLEPGTYTVTEVLKDGWTQTYPAAPGTHSVTLTNTGVTGKDFGNWQLGSIIIEKQTNPEGGMGFEFSGGLGNFILDDGGSQVFSDLAAGNYDVTEDTPEGWEVTSVVCTGGDCTAITNGVTIHLDLGEAITCTFTNEEQVPPLATIGITKTVTPTSAAPGDTVEYTIEYENPGDATLHNVVIVDDPDENYIASVSDISDGGTYNTDKITWNIGILNPLDSGSVTYKATLKGASAFPPAGSTNIDNIATIYSDETDPLSDDARVTVTTGPVVVGGTVVPVNKAAIVAPWLGLIALSVAGISWFALRRREARS